MALIPIRPDIPITKQKQTNKNQGLLNRNSYVTNDDLMAVITSFQSTQTYRFDELRQSIGSLTSDISALKPENAGLCFELSALKSKVLELEHNL